MKHSLQTLATLLLATFALSTSALPSLQLGPELVGGDPETQADGWGYNEITDTWDFTNVSPDGGVMLEALADTSKFPFDPDNANQTASLVLALVNRADAFTDEENAGIDCSSPIMTGTEITGCNDPDPLGNLWVTADADSGGSLTSKAGWEYGNAPISDPNDLSGHSIYPTFFQIFEFDFNTAGNVYDTELCEMASPIECDTSPGLVEQLIVGGTNFLGDYMLHIDLLTMAYDSDGNQTGDVWNNAPFSHDALISVPGPSQLALFALGLFLMLGARIRRNRAV